MQSGPFLLVLGWVAVPFLALICKSQSEAWTRRLLVDVWLVATPPSPESWHALASLQPGEVLVCSGSRGLWVVEGGFKPTSARGPDQAPVPLHPVWFIPLSN